MTEVDVRGESTPNPNSRRYVVDREVQKEVKGRFYTSADTQHPLLRELFSIEGVSSVMLLPRSITVSKTAEASWERLDAQAQSIIEGYFSSTAADEA